MRSNLFFFLSFFLLLTSCSEKETTWKPLFNGQNLDGFEKLNGTADYLVEEEMIVGISQMNTPNTFLATKEKYGDFILEFDVLIDSLLNSGVQFRSISDPQINNGRVHGYQSEIETSPRKWSGGIYDEGRRNWLYPLTQNKASQNAFQQGKWNHYRIQAIGTEINTWVNGVHCARLVDDLTDSGFIALQVHAIGAKEQEGLKVRWKNLKILTADLQKEQLPLDPKVPEVSYLKNKLTSFEKEQGWKLLWDGKTNEGWIGVQQNDFPNQGWKMEEGHLICKAADGKESLNGGDIITEKEYGNFELELDFRITEGANSGIKYFVDPGLNKDSGSAIGLEYQLLDDIKHPDAENGKDGNRTLASLYGLIPAKNLSEVNRKNKRFFGINTWNKAKIIANETKVEHWLNNLKVLEYNRFSSEFKALVEASKYSQWPNFGQLKNGQILLQDHGNEVHFRSIKIKEL